MENIRLYDKEPYSIAVIHGGPGAPGSMASVALQLQDKYGVIEPLQTANTVEGQVEELNNQLSSFSSPFVLIGHSWGAWLSILFAAKYPKMVKHIILVGCPPFKEEYAELIMPKRLNNLNDKDKNLAVTLLEKMRNSQLNDEEFKQFGNLMTKSDSYCSDKSVVVENSLPHQPEIFESVWTEVAELRKTGELIEIASKIKCPITFIHGKQDPHPYEGIQDVLNEHGIDFEFILFDKCGHSPWKEKHRANDFFNMLDVLLNEL